MTLLSLLLPISRALIARVQPHVAVKVSTIQNPRCWLISLALAEVKQGMYWAVETNIVSMDEQSQLRKTHKCRKLGCL